LRAASRLAALLAAAALAIAAPAQAGQPQKSKRHSGVKGVVLNSTCYGPCAEPAPPQPPYQGPVTVTVRRAGDGTLVASQEINDGHFRLRVKRGQYDVSSVPPNPPSCQPQPGQVCPAGAGAQPAVIMPCLTGETKRVQVRRHRFTRVELHVGNVCVV
jgi:hypothetical protein